jgi:hypothetical protein
VWLRGQGWVRFDPTAAVRPQRVDVGASAAAGASREWYQADWLQNIRNYWDIVNRWWNQAVTGFDALRQDGMLKPFGIRHTGVQALSITLAVSVSLLLAIGLGLALWRRKHDDPLLRAMRLLQQRLARAGVTRGTSEGPQQYLSRAAKALPHEHARLHTLMTAYLNLRYAQIEPKAESIHHFARLVRNFRPRIVVK